MWGACISEFMANTFHRFVNRMRREMKRLPATKPERLKFLIRWAAMTVKKEGTLQERREAFRRTRRSKKLTAAKCWCCARVAALVRHHVIQLQNGGGNWHLNIVPICDWCHAEVHPWMDAPDHPVLVEVARWDGPVPF